MSAAQKESLGDVIKTGSKGDPALPPSSSPSLPSCDPALRDSLGSVVGVAVSVLVECVEVEEATKEEMKALVSPAPPDLVDAADFECVLCTRYGLLCTVTEHLVKLTRFCIINQKLISKGHTRLIAGIP